MAVTQVTPEYVKILIKEKGAVGSAVQVACATSHNLAETRATQSVRCLGQAFDADSPEYSSYSATGSINGVYRFYTGADVAANKGLADFRTWLRTKKVLTFQVQTDVTDGTEETFDAIITNVTVDNPGDANSTYSVSYAVRDIPETVEIA